MSILFHMTQIQEPFMPLLKKLANIEKYLVLFLIFYAIKFLLALLAKFSLYFPLPSDNTNLRQYLL